jgi:hypothetical protein
MYPRLAKELRALWLAWCVAALAAAGYLVALNQSGFARGEFGSFLIGLAGFAFVAGCLLLAALPMGSELQERTLALLLSQPLERARLWKEKLLAATIAVGALAIVHGTAAGATGQVRLGEAVIYLLFLAAAICSAGYWTLATRSVIGGIVTAVGAPIGLSFAVHVTVYYGLGLRPGFDERTTTVLAICAGAVYSAFFLWLGRRQFVELELKDPLTWGNAQVPEAFVPKILVALFRCRPAGALRNLIRKEVCLQKPIFLISAVFATGWFLVFFLLVVEPAHQYIYVGTLNALTAIQIILTVVLTGCVSLGEEKALGLAAWHLTLPVSARRQWLVKLGVAAGVVVVMGFVLPLLLAVLTSIKTNVGLAYFLANKQPDGALWTSLALTVVFVLSFWSGSLAKDTVRAALICVLAFIGILVCVSLGAGIPEPFFISSPRHASGLTSGLLSSLIAYFQLSPYFFETHPGTVANSVLLVILAVTLILLTQSLVQFRRAQTQTAVLLKYSVILAVLVLAGSFWCADLMRSIRGQRESPLVAEVTDALSSVLRQDSKLSEGQVRRVMAQELESSDLLSYRAKLWLRNSTIDVHWNHWITSSREISSFARRYGNGPRSYIGELHLPNGVIVPFSWTGPDPPQAKSPKEKP